MITPMIIPVRDEPDICPKCKKEEDFKYVCKHCGYVYPEGEDDVEQGRMILKILFTVVIITWLLCTIIAWLVEQSGWGDKPTLVDMLVGQWDFIRNLRIW